MTSRTALLTILRMSIGGLYGRHRLCARSKQNATRSRAPDGATHLRPAAAGRLRFSLPPFPCCIPLREPGEGVRFSGAPPFRIHVAAALRCASRTHPPLAVLLGI